MAGKTRDEGSLTSLTWKKDGGKCSLVGNALKERRRERERDGRDNQPTSFLGPFLPKANIPKEGGTLHAHINKWAPSHCVCKLPLKRRNFAASMSD